MRIDNDLTKGLARPFLILAHVRTGGTFCAHALSNHSQIYCDRGETLHHLSAWHQAKISAQKTIDAIWHMDGYHAAGFRAIYRQAFHDAIWPLIESAHPYIIHLIRRNLARQALSFGYQQLVRQGKLPFHPVHTFDSHFPSPVEGDVNELVGYAVKVREEMKEGAARLAQYDGPVLEVVYEDMVEGGSAIQMAPSVAEQIETFLGVEREPLSVNLARDFQDPISAWFSNWRDVRRAMKQAGFGGWDG